MFWNCIQVFCGFFILFVDVGNGKFLMLPGKNSDPVNHITGYYKVIYIITEPVNELKPGIFKKSFAPYMDIRNKYSLSDPIFPFMVVFWEFGISGHIILFTNIRLPSEDRVPVIPMTSSSRIRFADSNSSLSLSLWIKIRNVPVGSSIWISLWPFEVVFISSTIPITDKGSLVSRFLFLRLSIGLAPSLFRSISPREL